MREDFRDRLSRIFPLGDDDLQELMNVVSFREVPSGTVLLSEGEIATKLLMVIKGCLRQYFIKEDGKEITFQFFVENQIVASFESATTGTPSRRSRLRRWRTGYSSLRIHSKLLMLH